ncbi:MAG: AAA family ATPase [Defluviitaleaceae bacterium]|nr:AAA family ATPase [Defluviitaleaceae bacterium]
MARGIIIFGLPGSGQTTLGRALAQQLGFPHFDLDDYHWRWDTEIPYTVLYPREAKAERLMSDVSKHSHFVMSGSMWSIRKMFEPMFDLAVCITVPPEVRAGRVCARELARWGDRVLPGGDMYEANEIYRKAYLDRVEAVEMAEQHKQWIAELPCPVVHVDGMLSIEDNVAHVIRATVHKM